MSSEWKFKNFRYHIEEPLEKLFCQMNGLNLGERFYFQDLGMVSLTLQRLQKPSESPKSSSRYNGYSKNYNGKTPALLLPRSLSHAIGFLLNVGKARGRKKQGLPLSPNLYVEEIYML